MLCVFTFSALFLLNDLARGQQCDSNVEEISSKFISPCPVASIRFGPRGRPWRIYIPKSSTIHTRFQNSSHINPDIDCIPLDDLKKYGDLQFLNHNNEEDEYTHNSISLLTGEKEKDFILSDKHFHFNGPNPIEESTLSIKLKKYLLEKAHKDTVANFVSLSKKLDDINDENGANVSGENKKNEEDFDLENKKSINDLFRKFEKISVTSTEILSHKTSEISSKDTIPLMLNGNKFESSTECTLGEPTSIRCMNIESVLGLPEIDNLKRSYGKHAKRPESEDNSDTDDDVLKKALQNFSDFITIKYLLGNNENSTDSLEILENILERLSIAPEPISSESPTTPLNLVTAEPTKSSSRATSSHTTSFHKHTTQRLSTRHHTTSRKSHGTSKPGKSGNTTTMKGPTIPPKPFTNRFRPASRVPPTTKSPQSSVTKSLSTSNNPPSSNFPVFDESGLFPYSQNQSVRDYVTYMSERAACMHYKNTLAQWNLETNMSHITHKQAMVTGLELIHFQRTLNRYLEPLAKENIQDPMLQREIKLLYLPGMSILPDIKIAEFEEILFAMDTIYSSATVNKWNNPQIRLHLDEIVQAMQRSQSPEELKYYWIEWRGATGHKLRSLFEQYIELQNLTAISNGFSDAGEMWTRDYETEDFMQLVGCHWEEIRPLYQELHAYVRARLHKYYGEVAIKCNHSPIPTHLTGELWGQSWKYLYNITEPYPKVNCNFCPDLKSKGFSKSKLISQAEHFYLSLGFPALPEGFWKRSVLNKAFSEMSSSSSSWDMHDGHDFRIKMCFNTTLEDYLTLYHELAYIEYFREYRNLSFPFRRGPNPAFHEGIAGALMLSIQSPAYLNKMGIIKLPNTKEGDINFLLNMALDKLAYLPYSYIVDLWRFRVFTGEIKPNDYNEKWWKMRLQYQGIIPPARRTSEDFDPGSEYHIATNKPYLQNFISTILQFQFYEAFCRKSGKVNEKIPLHKCDLHNSPQVGSLLRYVMQMGASRHWRVAMKALTDSRQINSRALLEYFSPLYDWLKKENFRTGQRVGWSDHLELA